jgi:hypothetical protein
MSTNNSAFIAATTQSTQFAQVDLRPRYLELVHVRAPPSESNDNYQHFYQSSLAKLLNVDCSYYSNGVYFATCPITDEYDYLLGTCVESGSVIVSAAN